jgi:hypothetical protein
MHLVIQNNRRKKQFGDACDIMTIKKSHAHKQIHKHYPIGLSFRFIGFDEKPTCVI